MDHPQQQRQQFINPLQLAEIRCRVFEFLKPKDLASCALVTSLWAIDTRRYLWRLVGRIKDNNSGSTSGGGSGGSCGRSNGVCWDQCLLPSRSAFLSRVDFIQELIIDSTNMVLICKLLASGSKLLHLKRLVGESLSTLELESFFELVYFLGSNLEYLQIYGLDWNLSSHFIGALIKAKNLKQLKFKGMVTGIRPTGRLIGGSGGGYDPVMLPSLTHLQLLGTKLRMQGSRNEGGDEDTSQIFELVELVSSCSNLVKLEIELPDTAHVVALARILPSMESLKDLVLRSKVDDRYIALLLAALPLNIWAIDLLAPKLGIQTLAMTERFLALKDVFLDCGNMILPAQSVVKILCHCRTLQTIISEAAFDGTDLALGPPWICKDLRMFDIDIVGASRTMTKPELMQSGIGEEFYQAANLGTHWMLYHRISLLKNLEVACLRLRGITHAQHAFGHGYEQLLGLKSLIRLYIPRFGSDLSSFEVATMVESCPRLKTLELGGYCCRMSASELLKKFYPKIKLA